MLRHLSNYFQNAVKSLNILECNDTLTSVTVLEDPIDIAIKRFENHPSIPAIKEKIPLNQDRFSFTETDLTEMEKEIKSLNTKKATTFNNIPPKILRDTSDICSPTLNNIWCDAVLNCKIKLADYSYI